MFEDRREVQQKGDYRKGGCVGCHSETVHKGLGLAEEHCLGHAEALYWSPNWMEGLVVEKDGRP